MQLSCVLQYTTLRNETSTTDRLHPDEERTLLLAIQPFLCLKQPMSIMSTLQDKLTLYSSLGLRVAAYLFLRWIPGHVSLPRPSPCARNETCTTLTDNVQQLPRIIYTLFAIYVPAFIASFSTQAQFNVIEDDILVSLDEDNRDDATAESGAIPKEENELGTQQERAGVKKKLVVDERIVVQKKSPKPWLSLLTGLPSPTSTLISLLTLLINIGLLLATIDLIYRARVFHPSSDLSFARLGYVSPTTASLLIREPNSTQWPVTVSYRPVPTTPVTKAVAWQTTSSVATLSNETDFTTALTLKLANLPDATYQWSTSNNHTGYFNAAPRAGEVSKSGTFTFLTSSCIKPRFPYSITSHPLSIPGFKYVADVVKQILGGAQFMLFLGDFIYIDVPKRFGATIEDYRREYRQVYASPDWPLAGQNLSWIHVIDDHEIANDWDGKKTGVYNEAVDPWNHYHASVNPPKARQAGTFNTARTDATYFEFTQGPASFFMMDTRTYRDVSSGLSPNSTNKSMLGPEQYLDLLAFLKKPEPSGVKWKIVISSVPFTKNWQVNSLDTWAGYLAERQRILEAMWDVGLRGGVGVVVLSGDRHEFAATAFPPPAGGKWPISATVNEFSTSPLSQFYLPVPTYRQADEEDVLVK